MSKIKKEHPKEKTELHPRNKHRERYDFKQLTEKCPELAEFVSINQYNDESIDFFNPQAVKTLNKALLNQFYEIEHWNIPDNYLCPPIPGRADYIHYCADLLAINSNKIPTGNIIKCLDIGVGANCVYPIIGNREYSWFFVGSDIDAISVESAKSIIKNNPILKDNIEIRQQSNAENIFKGIINEKEYFDLSICNPPFHSSLAEAESVNIRKLRNLNQKKINSPSLNFGGKNNELWYEGGEEKFIERMILESRQFANSVLWFSTLVSKQSSLKSVYSLLENIEVSEIKTLIMGQGNKVSRIVAWSFLNNEQQRNWIESKWK
ncbi:MAG: 23S rRNA (adenine(1618)-N(6))-methyltransferase RlmF [Bacteroidota bacterium]